MTEVRREVPYELERRKIRSTGEEKWQLKEEEKRREKEMLKSATIFHLRNIGQ